MTTLYMPMKDGLAVVRKQNGRWQVDLKLEGADCWGAAVDPLKPESVYCSSLGQGLWRSEDAGATWKPVGEGIQYNMVWSVAVSRSERVGGQAVVYAGTEPSALWRSEDGGTSWQERPTLREIPSHTKWSYPPKPKTHHVRCILPDPHRPERIFVGIEQGGVMRTQDGGLTWEDHHPQAQIDPHTLSAHPQKPGRIYEAGGGGYRESDDGGDTWETRSAGMRHSYTFGLAAHPDDPETLVISASSNFLTAHFPIVKSSTVYRKSGGSTWQEIRAGLPRPRGNYIYTLSANEAEPGVFYLGTREGDIYRSGDNGLNWERLVLVWPVGYRPRETHLLVATES